MIKWATIRHSIFFKFSLAFLFVGMIPLLVLSALSLNQFTDQVERNTENNFKQMVLYLSKNADDIFRNYNEISKNMYYNSPSIADRHGVTLEEEINSLGRINLMTINDFLKTILYSDTHIENALFVRKSDQAVFNESRVNKVLDSNEPFPPVSWAYTLSGQRKQLAVFPPHPETYFGSTRPVITFARNFNDTFGRIGPDVLVFGTLYFDVDLDIFDKLFQQLVLDRSDEVYVVDGNGYILYSNQDDKLGKRFDELAAKRSRTKLLYSEPVPFIGGQVIGLVSKADFYASLTQIRSNVIIATGICLLALLVLGVLFSRTFTRPVLDIMRMMVRVESGNLETSITTTRKDEMGRLAHGFNRMIERLKLFINDAYVAEIKHKQTELNALKTQIQPHYLYNTLEVIRMSAVADDAEEVANMIHALCGPARICDRLRRRVGNRSAGVGALVQLFSSDRGTVRPSDRPAGRLGGGLGGSAYFEAVHSTACRECGASRHPSKRGERHCACYNRKIGYGHGCYGIRQRHRNGFRNTRAASASAGGGRERDGEKHRPQKCACKDAPVMRGVVWNYDREPAGYRIFDSNAISAAKGGAAL